MKSQQWVAAATSALLLASLSASPAYSQEDHFKGKSYIKHVLLISIDGFHAVDYLNCSKGVKGVNGGDPYCPNLAELGENGLNYLETSTSKPSDSFSGIDGHR